MRRYLAFALLLGAVVAAGCGSGKPQAHEKTALSASGDQRFYGHIKSLTPSGSNYVLRFDPALFLTGVTAAVAQAEDQHVSCRPSKCPPVPNDNYRVDEGHRALTFIVAPGVRGTVLTVRGGRFQATTVTVRQLADVVAGKSSLKLFEPLESGVWILVHIDQVRTFAQQYLP
jgi:hypothetical protein